MIKLNGYRIELGEVENAILELSDIREACAMVVSESGKDVILVCLSCEPGSSAPPILRIKSHCARKLPKYMIPHKIRYFPDLPRTRNGKTDLTLLKNLVSC